MVKGNRCVMGWDMALHHAQTENIIGLPYSLLVNDMVLLAVRYRHVMLTKLLNTEGKGKTYSPDT